MRQYEYNKTIAISGDDHKLAAVFFNKIIPFRPFFGDIKRDLIEVPSCLYPRWLTRDVYQKMFEYTQLHSASIKIYEEEEKAVFTFSNDGYSIALQLGQSWFAEWRKVPAMTILPDHEDVKFLHRNMEVFFASKYIGKEFDVASVPIFTKKDEIVHLGSTSKTDIFELNIYNLNFIDASKTEWNQVIEFRKDEDSVRQLRNLKLFYYDNYSDKCTNYIKDSIDQKIDLYNNAISKHGFNTVNSSLSMLLDSKSILGAAAITVTALLTGEKDFAIVGAVSGGLIETTKIIFNLIKSKYELSTLKSNHELAFLINAKNKLSKI